MLQGKDRVVAIIDLRNQQLLEQGLYCLLFVQSFNPRSQGHSDHPIYHVACFRKTWAFSEISDEENVFNKPESNARGLGDLSVYFQEEYAD